MFNLSHVECKLRCLFISSGDSKKAAAYQTAEVRREVQTRHNSATGGTDRAFKALPPE